MKYGFLFLFLLICLGGQYTLHAQQIPVFNAYTYVPGLYNPATRIPEGQTQLYVGHRQYWLGFEDSPTSQYLMARTRLKDSRLSLGGIISKDQVGLINSSRSSAFMGYQLVHSDHHRFATGISLGIVSQRLALERLNVVDPQVAHSMVNITQPDASMGFWYKFVQDGWEVDADITAFQLPRKAALGDTGIYSLSNHLLATLGLRIDLGRQAAIQPLLMYRGLTFPNAQTAAHFDVGVRAFFLRDRLWFGVGLRTGQGGYHGGFGLRLKERLHITGIAELNTQLGTSFEVGVGYTLGPVEVKDLRLRKEPELPPTPVTLAVVTDNRFWEASMDSLPAKPADFDLFPVLNQKGIIEYGFRFEDEEDAYDLEEMAEVESVVEHMGEFVREILDLPTDPELKGVDTVFLITWLRESELELAFGANASYTGDWGSKVNVQYQINETQKARVIQKGLLDGEELALLKLYSISQTLSELLGVSQSRFSIRLYPEVEMEPLRKTTVRIRMVK